MSLKEKLDAMKAQSHTRIPQDAQDIMRRAIEDVRKSGLLDTTLKVGDRAPEFTLPDQNGRPVALSDLRGRWVALWWFPKAYTEG